MQFTDLLLVDDILPLDFSPFRTLEYRHYLEFFNAYLASTEGWHIGVANQTFEQALTALPIEAKLKARIIRFSPAQDLMPRLAYVSFLHNAVRMLPYFEQRKIPFILQLYPGGGFDLNQPQTNAHLWSVLLSPLCRKVIVTQRISEEYIRDTIGCDEDKIVFVYGGVFDSRISFDYSESKLFYGQSKDTLDVCFVAHRYGPNFAAKGFDHFVAVARSLAPRHPDVRFHVVGDYTPADLPLGEAADRFCFYGRQPEAFFDEFYRRMDIILSVNQPFAQSPGAFDGFPTGGCIEAGFRGVLNCVNDPLGLNLEFTDDRDIVLLDSEPEHSAERIGRLLDQPARLYELARANWRAFCRVFDTDRQLWVRTRLIAEELMRPEALIVRPRPVSSGLDGQTDNVVSYLHDQLQKHQDSLRDMGRRHADLVAAYKDLEKRHAQLMEWHRDLEQQLAMAREAAQSISSASALMHGPEAAREAYQFVHSRIRRVYRGVRARLARRML